MSLTGQWDTVNGEVLRCPTIQTSVHHDRQVLHLERQAIDDNTETNKTVIRLNIPQYSNTTEYCG